MAKTPNGAGTAADVSRITSHTTEWRSIDARRRAGGRGPLQPPDNGHHAHEIRLPCSARDVQLQQTALRRLTTPFFVVGRCHMARKRTNVDRGCQQCGTLFAPAVKSRKYCSRECYAASTDQRIERKCEHCGALFKPPNASVALGRGRFCSHKCLGAAQRTRIERNCEWCGKSFTTHPSEVKKGNGRFCSMACNRIGRNPDGVRPDKNGYLVQRIAPTKWVLQHRLAMERTLGRPLRSGETVHHRNGQRDDNRLKNLELWSTSQPKGQRVQDIQAWAQEFWVKYAGEFPTAYSPDLLAYMQQYIARHLNGQEIAAPSNGADPLKEDE